MGYEAITAESTLVLAISTILLVVFTLCIGWAQIKANKNVAGLQILLRLVERYESKELRETRNNLGMQLHSIGAPVPQNAEEILDFFETIGYMAKQKLIDRKLAWNDFSIPVLCYWSALEPFVHKMREQYDDKTVYEEAEWLYHFMLKKERSRRQNPSYTILQDILNEFFRSETSATIPRYSE